MLKRTIDAIAALLGLLVLSPLFFVVSILIKLDSEGPVFFLQPRIGRHGNVFRIVKFRTMVKNAETMGTGLKTSSSDMRITRVGRVLRKFSIDEIPQLINILKGEMSLVGPRPAPVVLLKRILDNSAERLKVRPGITGWAQVNGRAELTWQQKFDYDIWYVKHQSLWLDIRILLRTAFNVILARGVYTDRYAEEVKTRNSGL